MALQFHRTARDLPVPPDTRGYTRSQIRDACWRGQLPAEALAVIDPREVEQLIYDLWCDHWTDTQIATHTKHTTYTVARIRARLGLPARKTTGETTA